MDLCNISVIKSVMADAGINFHKEFGQNFLTNRIIPEDIADAAADTEDRLLCLVEYRKGGKFTLVTVGVDLSAFGEDPFAVAARMNVNAAREEEAVKHLRKADIFFL